MRTRPDRTTSTCSCGCACSFAPSLALEAEHADLYLLAGDEAAERGRVLRRDVLFLQRVELVDRHHAALLPCSPCEASLQVKKTQSAAPSFRAQCTLFAGT